ncbi:MAG TPA: hypothetical protein VMT53_24060 [Terriglobales bacterium]|nr:hypothetical protein [Terriglobales bacterium]
MRCWQYFYNSLSYPYATTSPVYSEVGGEPTRSQADAQYFVAWVDRLIAAAQNNPAWNTEQEKQEVISSFQSARQQFETLSR